jgi:hypothetical protein
MAESLQLPIDPKMHFYEGIQDLFRFDKIRGFQLISAIQYGTLYGVIFFFVGLLVEYFLPPANERTPIYKIFAEVIAQCLLMIILVFYIRKFVKAIPLLTSFFNVKQSKQIGFAPYAVEEFGGEFMLAAVFIGVQLHLLQKITILAQRFMKYFGVVRQTLTISKH